MNFFYFKKSDILERDINFYLEKILKLLTLICLLYLKEKGKKSILNLYYRNINGKLLFNSFYEDNFFNKTNIIINNSYINYTFSYKYKFPNKKVYLTLFYSIYKKGG